MNNSEKGVLGERLAVEYLYAKGYEILIQRYNKRVGEVDIIARDGETYVFAEVKARSSNAYGTPAEAVTPAKQRKITLAAVTYMLEHQLVEVGVRFDVLEVDLTTGEVNHIPAAFEAAE